MTKLIWGLKVVLVTAVWSLMMVVIVTQVSESRMLPDDMEVFCPDVVVCSDNETRKQGNLPKHPFQRIACCTACSCSETCAETNDCCFPPIDQSQFTECLYSTTKMVEDDGLFYPSFKMISLDAPSDPTREQSKTLTPLSETKTPCGDVNFRPFGTMLPVYHNRTIYKNPACAKNHGVFNWTFWEPTLVCRDLFDPQTSAFLQWLEYGYLPSTCYFNFHYPQNQVDLDIAVCYKSMKRFKSSCDLDTFPVPERLNISAGKVKTLCESGFFSPGLAYGQLFANVFCYICNIRDNLRFMTTSKHCRPIDADIRNPKHSLSYLLDARQFVNGGDPREHAMVPQVCGKVFQRMNHSKCRDLKCPLQQLRNENGDCVHITNADQGTRKYLVPVQVVVDGFHITSIDTFKQELETLSSAWDTVNPWQNVGWVCCELDSANSSSPAVVNLFLGVIISKNKGMSLQEFLARVQANLDKTWSLNVGKSMVTLRQVFARVSVYTTSSLGYLYGYQRATPRWAETIDRARFAMLDEAEQIILAMYKTDQRSFRQVSVEYMSKLYYCEQVELQPDEFTAYMLDIREDAPLAIALYNKITDKLMFENEFWLVRKPTGETLARICLSDSGYIKEDEKSGCPRIDPVGVPTMMVALACVFGV